MKSGSPRDPAKDSCSALAGRKKLVRSQDGESRIALPVEIIEEGQNMAATKNFESVAELLLDTPLYTPLHIETDDQRELLEDLLDGTRFDGHCAECHKGTTFVLQKTVANYPYYLDRIRTHKVIPDMKLAAFCSREPKHRLEFFVRVLESEILKIGQYPSLADLANDESKQYSKVLSRENAKELHRAIGLAAHEVGIGSFVYLRRIFERLIWSRFKAAQRKEGWKDADFMKLRMNEKVALLKSYLPPFLVSNSGIYSILSFGIHELTEEECLQDFAILKKSIILILAEDQRRKEQELEEEELANAIKLRQSKLKNKGEAAD
jgi:hypothetical protein